MFHWLKGFLIWSAKRFVYSLARFLCSVSSLVCLLIVSFILFTCLTVTSVGQLFWFYGLENGQALANQGEIQFSGNYRQTFEKEVSSSLKPVDEIAGVSEAYKQSLKRLIKPSVGVALGVARVQSLESSSPTRKNQPRAKQIVSLLKPSFHFKDVSGDQLLRRRKIIQEHSVAHEGASKGGGISTVNIELPIHQVMDTITTDLGTVQLYHHTVEGQWETVQTKAKTEHHRVKVKGQTIVCTIKTFIIFEEKTVITQVDDRKMPTLIEQPGKLERLLYQLGMKSEKDIQLVYTIAKQLDSSFIPPGLWRNDDSLPNPLPDSERASIGWLWPVPNYYRISSPYGPRWGEMHLGIDIPAPIGTAILAPKSGTVAYAGTASGYGLLLVINHANQEQTRYGHINRSLVKAGDSIEAGQLIAEVGNRGHSTGPHLHFEVRIHVTADTQFSRSLPAVNPATLFQ